MGNKGFTLVELMVVVVILGMVVAIAAPIIFDDGTIKTNIQSASDAEYIEKYEAPSKQTIKF